MIVVREREKEAYVLWKSIPAMLRILPEIEQRKMGYDTSDPVFAKLLSIQNKTQFCDVFGIGKNTPTQWEAEEDFQGKVDALSLGGHVMKFKKDIDFSFTQKVLRHGDANRVKLWKQLYEGWSEKIEHRNTNLNLDIVALVRQVQETAAKERGEVLED